MSEDLIKRADAIEAYSDIYWIDDRLNLAFREELDKIDEKIRNIPTVEVADRPQGEWIGEADGYADGEFVYDTWYCSNCDYAVDDDEPPTWNFCPNCGAHMAVKGADDEDA